MKLDQIRDQIKAWAPLVLWALSFIALCVIVFFLKSYRWGTCS